MINRRNLKVLALGSLVACVTIVLVTDPLIGNGSSQEREWREKKEAALKVINAAAGDMEAHVRDRAYVLRKAAEAEAAHRDFELYDSLCAAPLAERCRLEHFWYSVAGCFGVASVLAATVLFVHKPEPHV